MKPLTRTCKSNTCKKKFSPMNSTQIVCSVICASFYSKELREKKDKNLLLDIYRKNKKIKESIMTLSDCQKILQPLVNHIARLIDHNQPCISCRKTTGKPQGGHYHSTHAHPALRFNLHVIHLQDFKCNVYDSANIIGYNKGLIEVYGEEYQEYIEYGIVKEYPEIKLSIPEIKEAIPKARSIINSLKESNNIYPNHIVRREMRDIFNKQIGIYTK